MTVERKFGCVFFVATLIVTCILFVANQSVVAAGFHVAVVAWPGLLNTQGAKQFALFVGPVVLIFLEWWLIDTLFWRTAPEQPEEEDPLD